MNHQHICKGLWTPWAAVLCYRCHGPKKFGREIPREEYLAGLVPAPLELSDVATGVAQCDECGTTIAATRDVALCQAVALALATRESAGTSAELLQTGGMCCTLLAKAHRDYHVLVTYDVDGFVVCAYPGSYRSGEEPDDWAAVGDFECDASPTDVAEAVAAYVSAHPDWDACLRDA